MHRKINIFLFILGALISILGGVFEVSESLGGAATLILIIIGVFIGLLNIDVTEEAGFLLSALVFLFSVFFITPYMKDYAVLQNLAEILTNFAILTASATVIVSLRWVMTFTSSVKKTEVSEEEKKRELAKFEKAWAVVMVIAVAVVLVQVVLESFFDTSAYANILGIIDYAILGVFVIDLIIIYIEAKSFKVFIKTAWLDIIATIPFNMFFRFLKLVRIIRVVKILKAQKIAKLAGANRALKFFSHKSKFNEYVDKKK